jgi:GNAT superfamily N-acetyltransferase
MSAVIRNAIAADANAIGALAQEFQEYLRALGDRTHFEFTAETYLRDGFGPTLAFSGLVAERDGQVIGYLLYHFGYDTDRAMRVMHVIDLYVYASRRRLGVGEALMHRAAEICREAGGRELIWSVFSPNTLAFQFYEHLGAKWITELEFMSWPVPGRSTPALVVSAHRHEQRGLANQALQRTGGTAGGLPTAPTTNPPRWRRARA